MILFKKAADIGAHLASLAAKETKTGFVPTLGALHEGHLSLIAASRNKAEVTVCSIFVNPAQFNDPADLAKYPVTIEKDIFLLEQAGCDILFLPPVAEIYPNGVDTGTPPDLGFLDAILEGSKRPGHFQGVHKVMERLLRIVQPTMLFLGQKDYQQCMVIRQLIAETGSGTELTIVPTVRETGGLAMSSRNTRLSAEGRQRATVIYRALQYLQASLHSGNLNELVSTAEKMIMDAGFDKIDYVAIAKADTLEPVETWDGHTGVVALIAAFTEGVRLIDNMILF